MRKTAVTQQFARCFFRFGLTTVCAVSLPAASLFAADILVDRVNDTGAGSLRQGLSGAQTGDRLVFQPILNGTTLENGPLLNVGAGVTFLDANTITLNDNHVYTLAAPLTVNWAGTLTLNGILANGSTTGSLVNNGLGTLILGGTNTFSGGTTLSGGAVELLNSSALGTGTILVNNTVGTPTIILGDSVNLANAITLTTTTLILDTAAGTSAQVSGIISQQSSSTTPPVTTTGVLQISGTGILTLSGTNTFTGGVKVTDNSTINVQNASAFGTGTISNTGVMTLNLASGLTIANKFAPANNIIANVDSGTTTLSGAITETAASQLTKTGAGILNLTGANTFTGGTVITAGTLIGNAASLPGNITNDASLVFNQGGIATYAGTISGTGDVTKTGSGTLVFSGTDNLPTTFTVDKGELQVTGTVAGPINVTSLAAELSGTGNVGHVTNQGYLQPGTNTTIGNLTVNGNFNQTSGGITEIKINSAGNTPGVNNDHLTVNGQAQIDGKLNVIATGGGAFTAGTTYTILDATGGVTGHYTQASSNLSMFGVDVTYGANDVTFQLQQTTSLKAAATTANQLSVGTALDNIALSSSGDLFAMINTLGIETAAQQRQAMDQLSGELFGNLQTVALQMGDQFQQRVTNTLVSSDIFLVSQQPVQWDDMGLRGQSPNKLSRGWTQGYGVGGNLASDGNGASASYNMGGGLVGVDMGADESGRVGLVGGSSYATVHDGFNASGQVTSMQIGSYLLKQSETAYVLGTVNYAYNLNYTNRNVVIGSTSQLLHADFTGSQIGTNAEAGLKLAAGPFQVQPLVGLQYLYLCQQGVQESGGPAELVVARTRTDALRANIGARLVISQFEGPNGGLWTPYTHARFVSDLLDNDRLINASFNGAPAGGAFVAQGTHIGPNYGVIGEGFELLLNNSWSLYGGADVMIGEHITQATGSLAAISRW